MKQMEKAFYNNGTPHGGNMSAAYYPFSSLMPANTNAHTDNQTAKLPNGDILIMKEHCDWAPIPTIHRFIVMITSWREGFHKGNWVLSVFQVKRFPHRPPILNLFSKRFGPCKSRFSIFQHWYGHIWRREYAYPQIVNGQKFIGGQDRSELYVCPYTGNIYLSFRYVSGNSHWSWATAGTLPCIKRC